MASYSPDVQRLLADAPELPLTQAGLARNGSADAIRSQSLDLLFPRAKHKDAALAGLLLRLGYWSESHEIAQEVLSPEGSYWHAILHRMEPDPSNAGYWFRRVGRHAIFPELRQAAQEILQTNRSPGWKLEAEWDPLLFIEWCDEAQWQGGKAEATARAIQMAEWKLLFDWCAAK